MVHFQY